MLGQGTAAGLNGFIQQLLLHGTQGTAEIDPFMIVEIIVLYSENGINHKLRYIVKFNKPAVFFGTELTDRLAVTEISEAGDGVLADLLLNQFFGAHRVILHYGSDIACHGTACKQNAQDAEYKHPLYD
ncbi:hypothetical protein D3C81_1581420 [compost metagenome]